MSDAATRLHGKVAWVTGSAKRLGKAIALELAAHGADIVVHCRSSVDEARAVAQAIENLGRRAMIVQGDHSRREDVERMVAQIDAAHGKLDALVNSAADFPRIAFEQTTDAQWVAAIDSNLRGPWLCTQCALPLLRRAAPAHVVNLLDCMKDRPYPYHAAYWCAKGGLDVLTRALARELAPEIRVNSVSPGPVLPPEDMAESTREAVARETPLGRWGAPRDVAHAVRMLLESDYVTGVDIPVEGGRRLG